jgi:type VI secretion system protein ImpA
MSVIDINGLVKDLSPDSPCGENLEYDPAFGELERAARGKEEQSLGDAVVAAEPPDWRDVRKRSLELFARTLDLRVAVYLARASLNTDGVAGFADGLSLVRALLERYWSCVHPQLDPDDDNDPTFRVNTIATLCDRTATLLALQDVPLVSSRALGRFSLRQIQISAGEQAATAGEGESVPDQATINAAFMDADAAEVQATADCVTRSLGDLVAIDAILMEQAGAAHAPDLSALQDMLKHMQSILNRHVAQPGPDAETAADAGQPGAAPVRAAAGEINSREDAVRMMDKISQYFERTEPSSPIPLLMNRAKRLVSMSFMDILKDLAPNGVAQAASIGGIEEKN